MSDANQPELDELISLSQAADLTGLSASHLRLLVRKGDVWGRKLGRNWLTTEQAFRECIAQENKPRPKPQKDAGELPED